MAAKVWGEEYRTTTIHIRSYENGVLDGCFDNPYLPEGKAFHSAMQLLQEMERALDAMELPKSYTAVRGFAPTPELAAGEPAAESPSDGLATFAVRVIFRQNASWQGSVTWLEGKREQSFRSVLELLFLIDNALGCALRTQSA